MDPRQIPLWPPPLHTRTHPINLNCEHEAAIRSVKLVADLDGCEGLQCTEFADNPFQSFAGGIILISRL